MGSSVGTNSQKNSIANRWLGHREMPRDPHPTDTDISSVYSHFFEIFSITDTSVQESLTKSVVKLSLNDLASLPSWDNLKVPFRAISARYDIKWKEPLGRGQYADVFKVLTHLVRI